MKIDLHSVLDVLGEWANEKCVDTCSSGLPDPCRHVRAAIAAMEIGNAAAEVARRAARDGGGPA